LNYKSNIVDFNDFLTFANLF